MRVWPGAPYPLGATWPVTAGGVNFALFSEHATAVHLCLFDDVGRVGARVYRSPDRPRVARLSARPQARPVTDIV